MEKDHSYVVEIYYIKPVCRVKSKIAVESGFFLL